MKKGNEYDTHRVIEPKSVLPQPAIEVNSDMEIYNNEIRIDVQILNIDSASFTQIYSAAGKDAEETKEGILKIIKDHDRHQNPVARPGGMLIGTIEEVGPALEGRADLKVGDKVAALVSLSLTPLRIGEVVEIHPEVDQISIRDKIIPFKSGIYAKIPSDLPGNLVLSVLDVAGVPAQTTEVARSDGTITVVGGSGKAGMPCLYETKRRVEPTGKVIYSSYDDTRFGEIKEMDLANVCLEADTTDAVGTLERVEEIASGKSCDVVISCMDVKDTEITSILPTKDDGLIYFFSMAISFTKAVLGAEGVSRGVNVMVGNGYAESHGKVTLRIMRECKPLKDLCGELLI